jgi:hypothetical protein
MLPFSLSLSLFPVAPTLEHRAYVKCFVSLQFLNPTQSVGLLGRGISPLQGRYLPQCETAGSRVIGKPVAVLPARESGGKKIKNH